MGFNNMVKASNYLIYVSDYVLSYNEYPMEGKVK